jgi:predicted MFS family arabinose efflux permease
MGALFAILGGIERNIYLMLLGTFLVGSASASGYQARFAAIDLAVAGPNLMDPAGAIAELFGWPRLVGPYMVAAATLALATLVIQLFLRPDPYLLAQKNANRPALKKGGFRPALAYLKTNPLAFFAILAISIGHVAMVSVMVMTPVHMAHVDVTLTVIGLVISIHVIGMYAFSPIVGQISDRIGRVRAIQVGIAILLLSMLVSGVAAPDDEITLGIGLFLLGLGWSFTLIAGSALLSESVDPEMKPASQGASDLLMNLSGAAGGALAGVIIGTLNYAWLCFFAALPVAYLGVRSRRFTEKVSS